jgi:hypothetical protein
MARTEPARPAPSSSAPERAATASSEPARSTRWRLPRMASPERRSVEVVVTVRTVWAREERSLRLWDAEGGIGVGQRQGGEGQVSDRRGSRLSQSVNQSVSKS